MMILLLSTLMVMSVDASPCKVTRDLFGTYGVPERGGRQAPVYRYTLSNGIVSVQVIEYGATLTSIRLPDAMGHVDDVLLGFDDLQGYLSTGDPYFGATVGRVANRVAQGQFTVDNVTYKLFINNGNNSLHGGLRGFDKKLWTSRVDGGRVLMSYTSPDGEEGYPGQVEVTVTYTITPDNSLVIEYTATASKRTPINLTNHGYFNLAGHAAGVEALYNHFITIKADFITQTNSEQIPTGNFTPVDRSPWDLRIPTQLREAIKTTTSNGFDDNFVLPKRSLRDVVAMAWDPSSGRIMEIRTTQPGLQFYTSNSLANVTGKGQAQYTRHSAFCMEAQNFPDAVNHPNFPNSVFGPGDVYHQITELNFLRPVKKCITT